MRERLLEILKEKSFKKDVKRILASGRESTYYIDGKITTMDPEGAYLIANIVLEILKAFDVDAIGGYTLGADPIVGAVVGLSYQLRKPIYGFIVRKEPKTHGEMKLIEGPFKRGWKVALIDDVVTTGSSILKAAKAVEEEGAEVALTMAIVDRLEGGRKNLESKGYKFISIFTRKDFGIL
ncbi:MAG: orotate phosphoribosyltransferase [Acidobacteriota bacterium]